MFLNFYSGPFLRGYMKMFQRKQTLLRTVLKRYFNVLLNKKKPMHLSLLEKKNCGETNFQKIHVIWMSGL